MIRGYHFYDYASPDLANESGELAPQSSLQEDSQPVLQKNWWGGAQTELKNGKP